MKHFFIGRKEEQKILQQAFDSLEAEMVAVIGRRRVGKTFLIKETYQEHICFEITGLQNANLATQLAHFSFTLRRFSEGKAPLVEPSNWLEAFQQLVLYLDEFPKSQRQVLFFDELPWMASQKSGFLTGLGFFWNSWAVKENVVVVICGSAASWMIQKVVNNTGGLYNRVTKRIFLQAFSLQETQEYLHSKHLHFDPYQISLIYMAMGGIPHYLKEIEAGQSAVQNIDRICFSANGILRDEFDRLFSSLFADSERHIAAIRTLARSQQGLTRPQLIKQSKLSEGGSSSRVLKELEQSGFLTTYVPFGKKKKEQLYRLTDEYSLFYLKFIEGNAPDGQHTWQHLSQTQSWKSWSGYAFENLCLKHIGVIKKALGISGVYAKASTFHQKATTGEAGTQIDLVLDRNDQVVNLFEIKFYRSEWSLTEKQAKAIREKLRIFHESTQTRKYLMPILITPFGIRTNQHSLGLIERVLTLEDLFV